MIEEPPVLTIKRPVRRPTDTQISAFLNVPTGFVTDALGGSGALYPAIKPLGDGQDLACYAAGPALTVNTGPADILALLASLKYIQPGDIVVSAFGGYQGCASCGDRVAGMIKNNGAIGLVLDGPIRDYAGMVEVGLSTWCTGINPNSPVAKGPGTVGLAIQIGAMEVETGDMIVADRDGVVVVPFELIDPVLQRLERIKQLEVELDEEVTNGLKIPTAIAELLDSDQVRFID